MRFHINLVNSFLKTSEDLARTPQRPVVLLNFGAELSKLDQEEVLKALSAEREAGSFETFFKFLDSAAKLELAMEKASKPLKRKDFLANLGFSDRAKADEKSASDAQMLLNELVSVQDKVIDLVKSFLKTLDQRDLLEKQIKERLKDAAGPLKGAFEPKAIRPALISKLLK